MTTLEESAAVTEQSSAKAAALRTETVTGYEAFLGLAPAWGKLLGESPADHPFLEHAWMRSWWESFGHDSSLHIILVKDRGRVVGIAPLIMSRIRMFGIPVRRLGFFYNAHVPRSAFLVTSGDREPVFQAIWRHLMAERGDWDLLQLCQLREGSATLESMRRLAGDSGLPQGLWLSGESPYVPVSGSWQRYYEGLATKHRSNLRNRQKRLAQLGPVEREIITNEADVSEALESGFHIEEAAWKREAGTAISCDPDVRRFYETFAARAADAGWLRLNFLKVGERRAAFEYTLDYAEQSFLLKLGYDPEFSACSPSNLLLSMGIERAFTEGQKKYDFLGETAEWKCCWARDFAPNYWLYIFNKSPKAQLLHFVKFRLIPWAKTSPLVARVRSLISRVVAWFRGGGS